MALKFWRLAYLEAEKTYWKRSPSMSLAFARNHMLTVKGPFAPARSRRMHAQRQAARMTPAGHAAAPRAACILDFCDLQ